MELTDFDKWTLRTYKYVQQSGWNIPNMAEIRMRMVYIYERECYDFIYGEGILALNKEVNIFESLKKQKLLFRDSGMFHNPVQGSLAEVEIKKRGSYDKYEV